MSWGGQGSRAGSPSSGKLAQTEDMEAGKSCGQGQEHRSSETGGAPPVVCGLAACHPPETRAGRLQGQWLGCCRL